MKKNPYFLNTALAAVVGIALLIAVLVRTFAPAAILPRLNIPNLVLLSLLALLADYYVTGGKKRCYLWGLLLSGVTFGLLPLAAFFVSGLEALKLGIIGGIVFAVCTWLFSSIRERLSSGPVAKAAPVLSALGLYLAAQCFAGILL